MRGPRDERAIGAKAAVGHQQVNVRVPVRERAVRLNARDDADREIALAREHAHGVGHGPGGDAREVAEPLASPESKSGRMFG